MAKISKTHHLTKTGKIKKNPTPVPKLFIVTRDDLFDDGSDDGEKILTEIYVIANNKKEVEKEANSSNYFLNYDQVSGDGDWAGSEFSVSFERNATKEDFKKYPTLNELKE